MKKKNDNMEKEYKITLKKRWFVKNLDDKHVIEDFYIFEKSKDVILVNDYIKLFRFLDKDLMGVLLRLLIKEQNKIEL